MKALPKILAPILAIVLLVLFFLPYATLTLDIDEIYGIGGEEKKSFMLAEYTLGVDDFEDMGFEFFPLLIPISAIIAVVFIYFKPIVSIFAGFAGVLFNIINILITKSRFLSKLAESMVDFYGRDYAEEIIEEMEDAITTSPHIGFFAILLASLVLVALSAIAYMQNGGKVPAKLSAITGQFNSAGAIYCPVCNAAVPAGNLFCSNCGSSVAQANRPIVPPTPNPTPEPSQNPYSNFNAAPAGETTILSGAYTPTASSYNTGYTNAAPQAAPATPVCSKCGRPTNPAYRFCEFCGTPVSANNNSAPNANAYTGNNAPRANYNTYTNNSNNIR